MSKFAIYKFNTKFISFFYNSLPCFLFKMKRRSKVTDLIYSDDDLWDMTQVYMAKFKL